VNDEYIILINCF